MKKYEFSVIYMMFVDGKITKKFDTMYGTSHESIKRDLENIPNFVSWVHIAMLD